MLPVIIFLVFLLNIYQLMFPASCLALKTYTFGQLNIIGSGLLCIFVYVRYRQIDELIDRHPDLMKSLDPMNRNSLRLGLHLSLGCIIASTLHQIKYGPIDDLWAMINYLGSFCCFGLCAAYFWTNARLTDGILPFIGSPLMARARSKFTIVFIIFFAIFTIMGVLSQILVIGIQAHLWNLSFYISCGYTSSIFEWILAVMSCVYILTFTMEFKTIHWTIERPKITITENDKEMTVCTTEEV